MDRKIEDMRDRHWVVRFIHWDFDETNLPEAHYTIEADSPEQAAGLFNQQFPHLVVCKVTKALTI